MNRSNDYDPTIVNSIWEETTLYEIIDNINLLLSPDEMHLLSGIMLYLGNTRRLRPSQRWARIKFVSPVEKVPVVAGSVAATDPEGNLPGQVAIPAQ
jgi:hypothetical protein